MIGLISKGNVIMCHIICAAWKYVSSIWDKQGLFMFYTLIRTKPFFRLYIYIYKLCHNFQIGESSVILLKCFHYRTPCWGRSGCWLFFIYCGYYSVESVSVWRFVLYLAQENVLLYWFLSYFLPIPVSFHSYCNKF